MIKAINNSPLNFIQWYAKANGVYKGQLVKDDSGATPVAAAHTGATILGVALETQTTTNGLVNLVPIHGALLEIDYEPDATKQTCAVTDLGTQFDLVTTSNEMFVDLDDTTGGFLVLVGYDNDKKKAYCVVEDADCFLSI